MSDFKVKFTAAEMLISDFSAAKHVGKVRDLITVHNPGKDSLDRTLESRSIPRSVNRLNPTVGFN